MKNSLLVLTTLAVLMNGCAQKDKQYGTKYDVPVSFTETINPETNETITTAIYDQFHEGVKQSDIENKNFSCPNVEEIQNTPFGVKFVTCKSK